MESNDVIITTIIQIASLQSGIHIDRISLNTSINNDLRIDGDDISEMLERINQKFKLNYDGFYYSKYFNSENDIGLLAYFKRLFRKEDMPITYDVRVIDLVNWVKNGYWEENQSL